MKPQYITSVERCQSSFDAAELSAVLQSCISRILEDKSYKKIIDSPIPLYVYIKANSQLADLDGFYKNEKGVYVRTSNDIENDFTIVSIINRLMQIALPKNIQTCTIEILTKEKSNGPKSADEDSETPEFVAKESTITFDDVILPEETKSKIFRALSIIKNRNLIFNNWGFEKVDKSTKSIICFYGAPGTGKTRTAEAIGSYLGKKIVFSTYAQIESQYVGVGAKNLHSIFEFAEEHDAILFFDEADSFLSNRLSKTESSSDKHYNRMSNELFQLLERYNGCVIFATNLLTDIDNAFKSRIIDSIRFELPDRAARREMISYMLPDSFPLNKELEDADWEKLLDISEGFSGRDIRKSILLSLANAATLYTSNAVCSFSVNDVLVGFSEVKNSVEQMEEEINGTEIDPLIGQALLEQQEYNEKLVSIARSALNASGCQDNYAISIYKEITRSLLGIESEDYSLKPNDNIINVCNSLTQVKHKTEILDMAIKIVAANGDISNEENCFLQELMSGLAIRKDYKERVVLYAKSVALTNKESIEMYKLIFDN